MAVTRKTKSAGEKNSKAGAKSRKRKAKKPKVILSTKKVAVFSACVCCFCALFLGLSVVLNGNHGDSASAKNGNLSAVYDKKSEDAFEKSVENSKIQKKAESDNHATKIVEVQKNSFEQNENSVQKSLAGKKSYNENVFAADTVKKSAQNQAPEKNGSALKSPQSEKTKNSAVSLNSLSAKKENLSRNAEETAKNEKTPQRVENVVKNEQKLENVAKAEKVPKKTENVVKAENAVKVENVEKAESVSRNIGNVENAGKTVKIEKPAQKIIAASNQNQNENIQNQALKNSRFDIPKAVGGATVVIVIDDAGRSVENVKRYVNLPFPLTIAVLPKLANSRECAQISRNLGKEVILHQPMQSVNHSLDPGPGKITVDMSFAEISSIIKENLASLGPGVKGMNNHEGSEVTGDVLRIGAVLDACLENRIYFLDSRTTAQTKAPQAALERDMTIFEKAGPYIDNELSREKMLERLYETLRYANNHGHAIVIGHVDKSVNILPGLLLEMYPYIKAAGYRFATPSTLR